MAGVKLLGPHPPPVITSVAEALFGVWYVVNPAPPPHQANPRMSSPPRGPWITSDTHSVLLVPSVIEAIVRGRPDLPRSGFWSPNPLLAPHPGGDASPPFAARLAGSSYHPNGAPP